MMGPRLLGGCGTGNPSMMGPRLFGGRGTGNRSMVRRVWDRYMRNLIVHLSERA
jgi:hypothetical protein